MVEEKFLKDIYRLNEIVRYNTWPKIKNEYVSQHVFYVALFTNILCDRLKVSKDIKLKALEIAIIHDTPEMITNDITYDAKEAMPEIKDILLGYEKSFIFKHFPEVYSTFYGVDADSLVARQIFQVADTFSVVQYCENEVNLGNDYFREVLEEASKRLKEEFKKLERMGYKCQGMIV